MRRIGFDLRVKPYCNIEYFPCTCGIPSYNVAHHETSSAHRRSTPIIVPDWKSYLSNNFPLLTLKVIEGHNFSIGDLFHGVIIHGRPVASSIEIVGLACAKGSSAQPLLLSIDQGSCGSAEYVLSLF